MAEVLRDMIRRVLRVNCPEPALSYSVFEQTCQGLGIKILPYPFPKIPQCYSTTITHILHKDFNKVLRERIMNQLRPIANQLSVSVVITSKTLAGNNDREIETDKLSVINIKSTNLSPNDERKYSTILSFETRVFSFYTGEILVPIKLFCALVH